MSAEQQQIKEVTTKTYYARLNGCGYVFKSGKRASFEGGQYTTNDPVEIQELEELCDLPWNHLVHREYVPVNGLPEGVHVLRDVSSTPNNAVLPATQRGIQSNAASLAALAARSTAK